MSILLLNTNPTEGVQLARELHTPQHPVLIADSVETALPLASEHLPALLLITEHPEWETRQLIAEIRHGDHERALARATRILVAPDQPDEVELLAAYDAGADLAAAQGSVLLLRARISVLLEFPSLRREHQLRCGALEIDTAHQAVTIDGEPVTLSRREYSLLEMLARDPHRVFTKAELLAEVWNNRQVGVSRTLDTHASRLRTKLAAAGAHRLIVNVWGVGWRLMDGQSHQQARA